MLKISGLHVGYGNIEVLHGLNIEVNEGELVTIIGPNGAGKSTLLKTISGQLAPISGTIEFEGKPIQGMPPHKIVQMGISQCPEGRKLFSRSTVSENLLIGAYIRNNKAEAKVDSEKYMARFPVLGARRNQPAGTLSGGEQQMLATSRAMMSHPKIVLLDEPSMGLAPQLVKEIFKMIREIKKDGGTILLVEQNAAMALKIADRAYVLETGQISLEGKARDLLHNDSVRKSYLGEETSETKLP
ncbi:MAG: ABC transporter ATP-binding protein [Clostridiales bacterium]|nr:ABC transporter ATP-binding protein [Clostridiales bacterium]